MNQIEVTNHSVDGRITYLNSEYPISQVSEEFGRVIDVVLEHSCKDAIASLEWRAIDAGIYDFTLTMADARVWRQTVRILIDDTMLTFDVPGEFSCSCAHHRMDLRSRLIKAARRFEVVDVEVTTKE